jgi:hypothetical protein
MESTYEAEMPEPVAPEHPRPVGLIFLEPTDDKSTYDEPAYDKPAYDKPAGDAGVCNVDGVCS